MGGGGLCAKHLLPYCCVRDSLKYDMQHDHILKKLNFDLLTPIPMIEGGGGCGRRLRAKYLLLCCCIHDSL